MKLLCIDRGSYFFTPGKIYDGEICRSSVFEYFVINDKGFRHGVESGLFVDVAKVRQQTLERLGI